MFVCEQQRGSADILHVPVDVAVRGSEVEFARPLFNLRGTRVLGSELGGGSADASGKVHLTSTWEYHGIIVHGDYSGTLDAEQRDVDRHPIVARSGRRGAQPHLPSRLSSGCECSACGG